MALPPMLFTLAEIEGYSYGPTGNGAGYQKNEKD